MKFTPWDNPMGTDGFEFIEYAAPDPAALGRIETVFKAGIGYDRQALLASARGLIGYR